ncbi:MAG: SET domain-containing protein-lysine N-methyltransferase [Gemmatimonadaceae bacterium]|nr:SET domain-containing protein-lysine N-methyltransferase [Gemmatimonadaceae bacterium]
MATRKKKVPYVPVDPPFVVRKSSIQGRGGYATRDIRKGERIVEYLGERISWAEADRRYDDTKVKRHHTFLFTVNKRTIIDAAFDGNDARFINHSCDPNCEAVDEQNRIFIEAIKPIRKGEELSYDYSYSRDKDTTEEDEALYVCRCGTAKCRGTILEPPKKRRAKAPHHAASRHPGKQRKVGQAGKSKKRRSAAR